ncbi:MAG: NADPH-dependent ferric siderophore reductase [Oceanospirillaceae bacterium]|nr:NADPH-dependent ferric siderophore reductase [Oceanospirillaceae bacterium]
MPAQPMLLTVESTRRVTPNMQRLVLKGEDLAGFSSDNDGDYVKLMFHPDGRPVTESELSGRPLMRTYTVRSFDAEHQTIDVDFALHGDSGSDHQAGVASHWAEFARPGEQIRVGGPGPGRGIALEADWYLLAGDMTAIPALSTQLASLPDDARGYAVLEIQSAEDVQHLDAPSGIEMVWVVQEDSESVESRFVDRVKSLAWLGGEASVWAACEFSNMRQLRQYVRQERSVNRSKCYISSYWKNGSTEDQHKLAKREDAAKSDS